MMTLERRALLPKRRQKALTIAAGCMLCSMILAGPVLQLKDGRALEGKDLYRDGDLYMLEIAGGSVIPVPSATVKEVRWVEEGPSSGSDSSRTIANVVSGRSEEEQRDAERRAAEREQEEQAFAAQQRAEGDRLAQQRIARERAQAPEYARGVDLAGPPVRYPTPSEQLAVFGEPSKFQQDVAHFDLQPSYWVPDPDEAMGNPSKFTPISANATWTPTDGFAN